MSGGEPSTWIARNGGGPASEPRFAAAVVALLFVAAAVVAPRIALPLPISERLVPLVTGAWGFPFAAERVVWAGRNRITLHGVTVYAPEERAAARGAISADGLRREAPRPPVRGYDGRPGRVGRVVGGCAAVGGA